MIKKHLIVASVLLVSTTLISMSMSSKSSGGRLKSTLKRSEFRDEEPQSYVKESFVYHFANDTIPVENEQVAEKMQKALKGYHFKGKQKIKIQKRAAEWFAVIEPLLEQYDIPNDFKYVPLVESGLKSGTSPKGASGYWQFMPQTARNFGLKVNGNVDERQDLYKSTIAACKYLKSLYSMFNDWTLVAAAYNMGEGGLKKQIKRHKHRNYFNMALNKETAIYVYKLASMKWVIENPDQPEYLPSKKWLAKMPQDSTTTTVR